MENEPPRCSYNEIAEANQGLDDIEILRLFEDSLKAVQEYAKCQKKSQS